MESDEKAVTKSSSQRKKYCSIEDINFSSRLTRLDSPRSIEACFRLGIDPLELYLIDFPKFKEANKDLKSLPSDLQQLRYYHYEQYRQNSIQLIKEERNKIMKEQELNKSTHSVKSKDKSSKATIDKRIETLIEEEKKSINKIKQRQKMEIQALIETQVKTEMIRQMSATKELQLKDKTEKKQVEGMKKMKEMDEVKKQKEIIRQAEMNRKTEEQKKKILDKLEKEQRRINELMEQQRKQKEQMQKKAYEELNKVKGNKSQLELFLKSQKEEMSRKKQQQEEKDREQQEKLEKKRIERIKHSEIKKEKAEKRLRESRSQAENTLLKIKTAIEEKHKNNEIKLQDFFLQRSLSLKEQQEKNEKKQLEIQNSIRKVEETQEKKRKKFFEKQDKMDQLLFLNEVYRTEKTKQLSQYLEQKFIKLNENRRELTREDEVKKKDLLERFEIIDKRVLDQRLKEERDKLEKQELEKMKNFEKAMAINRMRRIKEYRNKIRMDELEEKERNLEEYKQQRLRMSLTKAQMSGEIQKEKQEIVAKFDKLIRNKKQMNVELVKELFPDDEALYNRIKKMHNGISCRAQSVSEASTPTPKKGSSFMNEKDIEKKVEEFRMKLRQDLNKMIAEEKDKEEKRVSKYENEEDVNEKQLLEKINSKERAESNHKVLKMQNEIEKKVKLYEAKVRKEQQQI